MITYSASVIIPRNILDKSWLRDSSISLELYPTANKAAVIAPALVPANLFIWGKIPSCSSSLKWKIKKLELNYDQVTLTFGEISSCSSNLKWKKKLRVKFWSSHFKYFYRFKMTHTFTLEYHRRYDSFIAL